MNQQHSEVILKGGPRLRFKNAEDTLSAARSGLHFWWWSYLRQSLDYWYVCHKKGHNADTRLQTMYWDFGNVYSQTFDEWWLSKGVQLFREQYELPKVRVIDRTRPEFSKGKQSHLILELPLHLTERTIMKQIRDHLRENPDRETQRISTAVRPLAKLTGVRMGLISNAFEVLKLYRESRLDDGPKPIGQIQGSKSLYQIGKELRLVESCMPAQFDTLSTSAKKVNGMKVAVSRMLSRANNLSMNAAVGDFPNVRPIEKSIVWKFRDPERMKTAAALGYWRPLFDANETLPEAPADLLPTIER